MARSSFRGIAAVTIALAVALACGCGEKPSEACAMCAKIPTPTTEVTLESVDGEVTRLCCARCAVLYLDRLDSEGSEFAEMRTTDYETKEPVRLTEAFFVYGSETVPCCVPSVLVVDDREAAADLAGHGGGRLMTYAGFRATLALESAEGCEMCSKSLDHEGARPCVLVAEDGRNHVTCCPHCALMLRRMMAERQNKHVFEIHCSDDDGGLFHVGSESRFVADSDATMCCRPMLVPCESPESAGTWVGEHGGRILTVEEAIELVQAAHHSGKNSGS